jgi:transposase
MDKTLPAVGIDVSKRTLDVRPSAERKAAHKRVANSADGFVQMQVWLQQRGISQAHVCLEATGTYSDAVAGFLYEQGHQVSLINPACLAAFRKSEGISTKTDKVDALLLAQYCQQKRPGLWHPTPAPVQQLQVLLRRMEQLEQMRQEEVNRLENQRVDELTRAQIQEHIGWLEQQLQQTRQRAESLVEQESSLQPAVESFDSVPGIAILSAMRVLSVLVDWHHFASADQVVRFVGLDVQQSTSGSSVQGQPHISKRGCALLRKWLYMCALGLLAHDADFRRWGAELRARGKTGMVIVVAVMRKLLRILYGVWKSGQPYDARLTFYHNFQVESEAKESRAAK